MSGELNGCQKNLSDILGRNVPYIPCQDHRTNTALEHACEASSILTEMFNNLESLYAFFVGSTKRFQKLKSKWKKLKIHCS